MSGKKHLTEVVVLRLTWHTEEVSKKKDVIRLALNQKGVCITEGIPEHILELLSLNGYKIKKRKKVKQWT